MFIYFAVALSILQFTASYPDGIAWKLAYNIHASDGHNFGYRFDVWEDDSDVGSDSEALTADYKSFNVTQETANFLAIARHQNGVCEAARVWKFLNSGKTLSEYLDSDLTVRFIATHDNYTSSYISPKMLHRAKDPFFSVDGGIVFNWVYSDNGVRIANSNFYCGKDRPTEHQNSDDYWGLGNDYCWAGSGCWFDASMTRCANINQGTDHGSSSYLRTLNNSVLLGQYAVYVSDKAGSFPCEGFELQTSMYYIGTEFDRVDRDDDSAVNYKEFVFDKADTDRDNVLSRQEYTKARSETKLADTGANRDTMIDFERIDRDNNGLLNFNEVEFDIADTNKDGRLSHFEYYMARIDRETK